jgi:hypothetical protein
LQATPFGSSQDTAISADFDGDGKTDYAVCRGVQQGGDLVWYWLESSTGAFRALQFGSGTRDLIVPGDYDGDGKTDQAVLRWDVNSNSLVFYVNRSTGGMTAFNWGAQTDQAVANPIMW